LSNNFIYEFRGQLIYNVLNENKQNNPNIIEFFSNYFITLWNEKIEINSKLQVEELISIYIYKKIVYSVIKKLPRKDEKEICEFFEMLIKYICKSINNTSEFISFCFLKM